MDLTGSILPRSAGQGRLCAARRIICALLLAAASFGPHAYANAASISGVVKFIGSVPKLPPIRVTKDQDYCGLQLPSEVYLVGPSGGIKNVVVFIERSGGDPAPSTRENILDNRGCRFAPRVMAMRWGERLVVKSSDLKLHVVHAYFEKRTVFNLSLPFRNSRIDITQKIKRPATLQVNCDTHSWMRAYIHVFAHPFFAVTDESGSFSISDVPPGRYTLKAWHEEAGLQSADVFVPEAGEARIDFEFRAQAVPTIY